MNSSRGGAAAGTGAGQQPRPSGPTAAVARRLLLVVLAPLLALTLVVPAAQADDVGGDDEGDGYVATGSVLLDASYDGSDGDRRGAADCPGCRWRLRSVCRPGELAGEESCAGAWAGCPVGATRMRLFVWAPAEPWWRDIGTICAGAPDAIVSIDDIGTRVRDRVEEYLPVLRPALQPAGRTLAGLPTVLLSRQPRSVGPVALDVLGHEVRLTATPRWRWGFDAGDDVVTAHPGSPWPAAPLTHVFAVPGRARVEVTTTWTATFTVEGFGPFDVPPPLVTQTARLAIVVAEGRAHLVG